MTHSSPCATNREANQLSRQGAGALPTQAGGEVQRSCQVCLTNTHTGNGLGNLCLALPSLRARLDTQIKYSLNFKRNEYFGRMHKNKYRLKYIGPIFKNVTAIYFFKEHKVETKEENRPHNKEQWPGKTFPEHYSLQDRLPFTPDLIKQCLVTHTVSFLHHADWLISSLHINYYSFRKLWYQGSGTILYYWQFYKIRFLFWGTTWSVHLYKIQVW